MKERLLKLQDNLGTRSLGARAMGIHICDGDVNPLVHAGEIARAPHAKRVVFRR